MRRMASSVSFLLFVSHNLDINSVLSSIVASFAPFLKEVWDKKPEIEHAFHMEEPLTIDSGEGTMEHSMHHHQQPPQVPPRFESYLINGSYRHHNFDKMSHRSVNSLDEESVVPDERQAYSNMYFYEENNSDADKDERGRMLGKSKFHLHKISFLMSHFLTVLQGRRRRLAKSFSSLAHFIAHAHL